MNEEGRPPGGPPQQQNTTDSLSLQGRCDSAAGNRLVLLPLGERGWYPCRACAYCGNHERLRLAVLPTGAEAMVCADVAACERRRYWKRVRAFERVDQGRAA